MLHKSSNLIGSEEANINCISDFWWLSPISLVVLVVMQQTPVMDLSAVYVLVTLSKVLFLKWKPNEQEIIPVGCFLTAKVASTPERGWGGGRYTLFPLDTLHPKYLPYGYPTPWFPTSQISYPLEGKWTWDILSPLKDLVPGIPYPLCRLWTKWQMPVKTLPSRNFIGSR